MAQQKRLRIAKPEEKLQEPIFDQGMIEEWLRSFELEKSRSKKFGSGLVRSTGLDVGLSYKTLCAALSTPLPAQETSTRKEKETLSQRKRKRDESDEEQQAKPQTPEIPDSTSESETSIEDRSTPPSTEESMRQATEEFVQLRIG